MSRLHSCFLTNSIYVLFFFFFFQAEDGIRDLIVTGVQTCALPISRRQVTSISFRRYDSQTMGCGHGSSASDARGPFKLYRCRGLLARWQVTRDRKSVV